MKKVVIIVSMLISAVCSMSATAMPTPEPVPTPTPTPEVIDRITYWQEHPDESPLILLGEARLLATVADAVAPNGDAVCKKAVMQCVLNRVKTAGFPDTIEGVCSQKFQWEGYRSNAKPSDETVTLAREVLEAYRADGVTVLEIPKNCVYLCKTADGIEFRAEWDGTETTFIPYEGEAA